MNRCKIQNGSRTGNRLDRLNLAVIVLDTNVVSELMHTAPEPAVLRWFRGQVSQELVVTAITIAEILYGIEILPAGKRRDALHAGAQKMFGVVLADRTAPFDDSAARIFPVIVAERRRLGRPIEKMDAQIAAIARSRAATLATRNIEDFEDCGLGLVNPWQSKS